MNIREIPITRGSTQSIPISVQKIGEARSSVAAFPSDLPIIALPVSDISTTETAKH